MYQAAARRCRLGDQLGRAEAQLGAQQLAHQRVIAVPGPLVAVRRDERVLALEPRQHVVGVRAAGQGVREIAADHVDDRGPQQELDELVRLLREHLAEEVVGHRGVVAGERRDEARGVRVRLQGQRREAQPRGPSLGAQPQLADVRGGELDAGGLEQVGRLGLGEGEVGLADLGQLPGEPEPAEPERRVHARGDHDPQRARRMPQQPVEVGEHAAVAHLVEVVEHQHDGLLELHQGVDQGGDQQVDALDRVDGERRDGLGHPGGGEGVEHAAPEAAAIPVGAVEREPRDDPGAVAAPPPRRPASRSCPRPRPRRAG